MIAYFGPGGPNFTPDHILRDRSKDRRFVTDVEEISGRDRDKTGMD